jgi:O-succinylbenzoate synthase
VGDYIFGMSVVAVEIHRIAMPLVRPFETPLGRRNVRDLILIHVITGDAEGWGECIALTDPVYSSEFVAGAETVLRDYLVPALLDEPDTPAAEFASLVSSVVGHRMAKAALETALLDAELRAAGVSFATHFGAVRTEVECGVTVGVGTSISALVDEVAGYVSEGYRRIALRIRPGWDIEPVRAVRAELGDDALLQVDGGMQYTAADIRQLAELDAFDLVLIEQPFDADDVSSHILLAETVDTAVCLDESITSSAIAVDAIERGALRIANVKAGRVGGYLEAVRVHDVCAELGIPVWCGGMLETGVGRAGNLALAAMENFLLPADIPASNRYFAEDLTEPLVLNDGVLPVPTAPGSGVTVREDLLHDWALGAPLVLHAA